MNVQVARLSLLNGTRRATYPEMGEVAAKRGTLYVLVEVSAPADEWDSISRSLVDGAIEAFVVHKGPDTAALKEIVAAVNQLVLDENGERPASDAVWVGINAVFMREEEMYLLQAGPALTYIGRGSSVTRFPKTIDDSVLAPLGEQESVEARLAKFALQTDDVVAMTGSFLPSFVPEEHLNEAMRSGSAEDVSDALAALAQSELSSLVIQYEPTSVMVDPKVFITPSTVKQPILPSKPAAAPLPTAPMQEARRKEDSAGTPSLSPRVAKEEPAPPAAPTRPMMPPATPTRAMEEEPPTTSGLRSRFSGERVSSTEGEKAETFSTLPPKQEEAPRKSSGRTRNRQQPKASADDADVISGIARRVEAEEPPPARAPRKKADTPRPAAPPVPMPPFATQSAAAMDSPAAPGAPPILRQIGALLLTLLAALVGGLAQAIAWIERTLAPRVASSGGVLDRAADGFWRGVDEAALAGRQLMNQMLPGERPDPVRPPRQAAPMRGDGSVFLRTLVILIPLILVLTAAGVWFFGDEERAPAFSVNRTGEATYATLMEEAQALVNEAQNVDAATAQTLIARALPLLEQAEALATTEGEAATVAALRVQAQSLLTLAGSGTAVTPQPIVTFSAPMTATELVYGANALYLIDPARGTLYRLLPDQPPVSDINTLRPLLTAQERLAAGVTVGTPYQMTWIPAGGGRTGHGLLTLTQEGQMFDFDVSSSLLRQVSFASVTGEIVASEGYGGNLYHLDVGNTQIWKYVPDSTGEYPSAPSPWLTATGQQQFGAPIDMAVDGYIFLLEGSGEVRRFQVGETKAGFALDPVSPPLTQPVAMAKVPPESTDLFVADAQRVVRFAPDGRFMAEYRPAPGSNWGQIRDIAVNEQSTTLYILSDTGVYAVALSAAPAPTE